MLHHRWARINLLADKLINVIRRQWSESHFFLVFFSSLRMFLKVFSTTVASRTIFYIHVEVVSLWMARRNEKETAGLENMFLLNIWCLLLKYC